MQSARFVTAVALRQGSCWLDSFSPQQRADETITSFAAQHVDVREDGRLAEGAVRVLLRGAAGDLELGRDYPHGDSRDPLTAAEVEAKAARCVAAGLPPGRAGAAAAALAGLPAAPDITTLTRAVTG
jgi:2-methylcitrate dehydratase PrpD